MTALHRQRCTVAVLYADPRGPYSSLECDVWGSDRDARQYRGTNPVVCHPPCGPWGRLRHLAKHDDPDTARHAVAAVRSWGGILEHPAGSRLWADQNLPPAGGIVVDDHGGFTVELLQGDYGHRAPKPTWLYCVRVPFKALRRVGRPVSGRVENMSHRERIHTPLELAAFLLSWASEVKA